MRKILLFLSLLTLLPFVASAKDVTLSTSDFTGSLVPLTKDGVTFKFSGGNNAQNDPKLNSTYIQFYGGNKLVIEGSQIQKVAIAVTSTGYAGAPAANGVTFVTSGTTVTGTLAAPLDKIEISNGTSSSQKQMRIKTITVTVSDGGQTVLSAPEISVGESSFTISSVEHADVYYCVNKSNTATAEDCTLPYEGEVAFASEPGFYYIHAYAKSQDTDSFVDSSVSTVSYKVSDPDVVCLKIPVTGEAFNSAETKYISEHKFTYDGNTYEVTQVNPSTGQVKGNSDPMFSFYNITPIGNVESVALVTSAGTFNAEKVFVAGGDAALDSNPSDGGVAGKLEDSNISLYLNEPKDYFRVWFTSGATSATCKISDILIYCKPAAVPEKTPLAAPVLTVDEQAQTVTISKENAEGTIYYVVDGKDTATAAECTETYEAPVAFGVVPGVYYVHAYVSAGDSEYYTDSEVAHVMYEVVAPEPVRLAAPEIAVGLDSFTISAVENGDVYYCVTTAASATAEDCTLPYEGEVPFVKEPATYYIHAYAKAADTDKYLDSEVVTASYTVDESDVNVYKETIDASRLSLDTTVSSYQSGSWTSPVTGVTYNYNVAYNNGNLQFNDKNSDKGIWTTSNPDGYRVLSVSVVWGSGSNEFDVYGSKTAYTGVSDLYGADTQGTLLDGFTASGSVDVEDVCKFLGFRSKKGAVYIKSIEITYDATPDHAVLEEYVAPFAGKNYDMTVGETLTIEQGETHPAVTYEVTEGADSVEISAEGVVTAKAKGEAKVTATWSADDKWAAGEAGFTVTVKAQPVRLGTPVIDVDTDELVYTISHDNDCEAVIMYAQTAQGETPAEADWNEYVAVVTKASVPGTYTVHAYVKAPADSDDYLDSEVVTADYTVVEKPVVYAPVADPPEGVFEEKVSVTLAFAEGNADLDTDKYVIAYTATGIAADWTAYTAPVELTYDACGASPVIKAVVRDSATLEPVSEEAEFSYTLVPAAVSADGIGAAFAMGEECETVTEGDLEVSVRDFVIASALHPYAAEGSSVYVTDNADGMGARIDGVPADMTSDKVLVNTVVKYVKDSATGVKSFRYVGHATGDDDAAPAHSTVQLGEFRAALADHMHRYVKVENVYYDTDSHDISTLPAALEAVSRAPEGNEDALVIDDSRLADKRSGRTSVYGYVEHVDSAPLFIALSTDEIVGVAGVMADGGVMVADGRIVAPEGSRVYTVGGLRVDDAARLVPGLYIVRLSDGRAVSVMVK